jgi:hypothetical protein
LVVEIYVTQDSFWIRVSVGMVGCIKVNLCPFRAGVMVQGVIFVWVSRDVSFTVTVRVKNGFSIRVKFNRCALSN